MITLFWSDLTDFVVSLLAAYVVWKVTRRYETRRRQVLEPEPAPAAALAPDVG